MKTLQTQAPDQLLDDGSTPTDELLSVLLAKDERITIEELRWRRGRAVADDDEKMALACAVAIDRRLYPAIPSEVPSAAVAMARLLSNTDLAEAFRNAKAAEGDDAARAAGIFGREIARRADNHNHIE